MGEVRDTRRMASDLLVMAREVLGFEFPSQDALDKYLKDHPKAKKENHWVKGQKQEKKPQDSTAEKTGEKTEDSTGKRFEIPESKLVKYEVKGDLGNIENWKAKIVVGNSLGKKQKVGQMDEVGYVGINTRTNEIVPIARGDEHRSGYELLHHLHEKGAIKGDPQDFITLFDGNNYPHYTTSDTHKYAKAVKKWLAYGGNNVCVHSQGQNGSGNYITDMEEYVALDGKVPYGQKGPSKPAREVLDGLEGAVKGVREGSYAGSGISWDLEWVCVSAFEDSECDAS